MRPAHSLLLLVALCTALVLTGCQNRSLGEILWPERHDVFFQLTKAWSRAGVVRDGLETETRVVALFKSEPWRRGYVQRYAQIFGLTAEETDKMLAEQLQNHARETEFVLAVSSTYPENARLTHRLSQWRVLLLDPAGQTTAALEIRPMEVHESQLRAFFPHYHPWQRYYTLRFPKIEAGPLVMLFTGPPGQFTLSWDDV
jgi:hypothetical protein